LPDKDTSALYEEVKKKKKGKSEKGKKKKRAADDSPPDERTAKVPRIDGADVMERTFYG
jgi:hypothetical protein